jgi:hypothetical protein
MGLLLWKFLSYINVLEKKKGDCPNYCSLASFGDLELLRLFLATNNGSGLSPPKGNFVGVMRDTHHRI